MLLICVYFFYCCILGDVCVIDEDVDLFVGICCCFGSGFVGREVGGIYFKK